MHLHAIINLAYLLASVLFIFGLKGLSYEVVPINPKATEVEGTRCYPDLASVPGELDGVVVATPPAAGVAQ